jgi:rhamnulose-1-phosphate aldolase
MKNILQMPIINEMARTTANMYRLGWHERNAGNISILLDESEVAEHLNLNNVIRVLPLKASAKDMAGKIFLVTGTGKYFKNVEVDPEANLGVVRIAKCGLNAELLWGFSDGGTFTSEFSAHLMCHAARLKINPLNRVIMHGHPNNLVAMCYAHTLNEREFSRTLWQLCIEAILIFPEGVGVLPWMLCGTNEIAAATAKKMEEFKIVLWAMHGVFGCGNNLDETFGLIETAEKGADIFIKTLNAPRLNTTSDEQIRALAEFWNVKYRKEWL